MDIELESKRFIIDFNHDEQYFYSNESLYLKNKPLKSDFFSSKSPTIKAKIIDDQNCHPNIVESYDFKNAKITKLEKSIENLKVDVKQLTTEISILKREKIILEVKNHSLEEQKKDIECRACAIYQEMERQTFLNSVLEQKNDELNYQISLDRLNNNENLVEKRKKFKEEIDKLNKEKLMYEERANAMCIQMTEQMTLLQSTAMKRIEVDIKIKYYK